jgi:hypothetical protein
LRFLRRILIHSESFAGLKNLVILVWVRGMVGFLNKQGSGLSDRVYSVVVQRTSGSVFEISEARRLQGIHSELE